MKPFRWPLDKNELLKQERGVSFEEITVAVESGGLLGIVPHQNPQQQNQHQDEKSVRQSSSALLRRVGLTIASRNLTRHFLATLEKKLEKRHSSILQSVLQPWIAIHLL